MSRSVLASALPLALAASLAAAAPPAGGLERWLWNPRERTAEGLERLRRGDPESAVRAFDTAARVAGEDPRTLLNAGAAHLFAGDPEGSLPLLERAAELAPPSMAAAAQYGLGTAHLVAGAQPSRSDRSTGNEDHIAGAIAALEEALRLRPDFSEAKHNLELALRAQERQQRQRDEREQQQRGSQGSQPQDRKPPPNPQPADPSKPAEQPQEGAAGRPEPKPEGARQEHNQSGHEPSPEAPEADAGLTPEQVSRLLAAVENLERQQRRQLGAKRLSRPAGVEKDW